MSFVEGSPNSKGVTHQDVVHVQQALGEAADKGVVIVAMHAPPFNLKRNKYPHYLRETEHPTLVEERHQVEGLLRRIAPDDFMPPVPVVVGPAYVVPSDAPAAGADHILPQFPRSGTAHFMRGPVKALLDFNAADRSEDLLRLCTGGGVGNSRPVDLVLCGHTHFNVECRFRWNRQEHGEDIYDFFHDYYTQSPEHYYRTAYSELPKKSGGKKLIIATTFHAVDVSKNDEPASACNSDKPNDVPRYAGDLKSSSSPAKWWTDHRPLVIQTAGLGPLENDQRTSPCDVTFQGFRRIVVKDGAIQEIECVKLTGIR
jgi:hypothetical protein